MKCSVTTFILTDYIIFDVQFLRGTVVVVVVWQLDLQPPM